MISSTEDILFTVLDRCALELQMDVFSVLLKPRHILTITLSGALGSLAGNQRSPYQWEVLWIKQDLCVEPWMVTWWPTGMLPGREIWSLYLSILYPIRLSPSITPSTERMGTAFTKPHPLFTSPLSSSFHPSLLSLFFSTLQYLAIFTLFSHNYILLIYQQSRMLVIAFQNDHWLFTNLVSLLAGLYNC